MMSATFALTRGLYAMAQDGLIFRFLGTVSSCTSTPFLGTWVCGVLVASLGLLADLTMLVEMMSIGTLMAYTMVAVSVLVQHYQREQVRPSETLHSQIRTFSFYHNLRQ